MTELSIADQIKALTELQKVDAQIHQLEGELTAKPAEAEQLKRAQQEAAEALEASEGRYKMMEVKRKDLENDLAAKEGQIKKLQGQLFKVKTNKEYAALQKEIEGLKADNSVLEEEILKMMEEVDRVKQQVALDQEAIRKSEAELKNRLGRLEEETQRCNAALAHLRQERERVTPNLDPKVLQQYERILARKEGLALVPVRGEACGGCHLVLPPQVVNEIQMLSRLITCESCARILYMDPASS